VWGVVKVKTYQSHRNSIDLLKILQHKRKVQTKQMSSLHKKLKGNEFLEQVALSLQSDEMSTIQVELNMQRNISNTEGSFRVISHIVSTRV